MSETSGAIYCPACGAAYQLSAEYMAQYGGQQTQCTKCSTSITIPTSVPIPISASVVGPTPVLGYMNANGGARGIWREGKAIVASREIQFPARCVKCNEPVDGPPMGRKYYWHNPWLYFIILFNIIVYAVVAMIIRKSGRVEIFLCRRHRARRRWLVLCAWLSFLFSIMSFFLAVGMASFNASSKQEAAAPLLAVLGLLLLVASIVIGFILARILWPTRIDDRYLWLRGAGPQFLATLDETGVVLRR